MAKDAPSSSVGDVVDEGLVEWAAVAPDFDVLTVELLARLGRVRSHIEAALLPYYDAHRLTAPAFYVLATLRRHPPTFELTQHELGRALALTPGTVSVRVTQMEADELVTRRPDPRSARGVLVAATAIGVARYDACAAELRPVQERLFSALDLGHRDSLAELLRRLLLSYEGEQIGGHRCEAVGVTVAPAHVARAQRAQVGLPDVTGLLVTAVAADGAACAAGLTKGDLLVAANGRPLHSILDLPYPPLRLELLRGLERVRTTVPVRRQ